MPQIFRFFHSGSFSASSSSSDSSANTGSGWVLKEETSQQFKTVNQRFLPGAGRKIKLDIRILILIFLAGSKVASIWGVFLQNCTSLLNIYVKPEERHLRSHTKVILPTSERRDAWVRRAVVAQDVHTWLIAFVLTVCCYLRFVCWGDPVGVFCSLLGVT